MRVRLGAPNFLAVAIPVILGVSSAPLLRAQATPA
jgi:hypothetical protein